jgi:CRP-like cAMP-binding protein
MAMPTPSTFATFHKTTTSSERVQALDRTRWFDDVQWSFLEKLAHYVECYEFPPKFMLFDEGDTEAYLGIVINGVVCVDKCDEHGVRKEICQLGRGKAFGEISLIDGFARSARVTTITQSEILILSRDQFDKLTVDLPKLGVQLLLKLGRLLSGRLRATSGRLVEYLQD